VSFDMWPVRGHSGERCKRISGVYTKFRSDGGRVTSDVNRIGQILLLKKGNANKQLQTGIFCVTVPYHK